MSHAVASIPWRSVASGQTQQPRPTFLVGIAMRNNIGADQVRQTSAGSQVYMRDEEYCFWNHQPLLPLDPASLLDSSPRLPAHASLRQSPTDTRLDLTRQPTNPSHIRPARLDDSHDFTMQIQLFALFAVLLTPAFGVVIRSPEAQPVGLDLYPQSNIAQRDGSHSGAVNFARANPPPAFKRVTNAERLKRGLGPLPPTKRSSAAKARRSGNPDTQPADESGDFNAPSVIRLRNPRDGSDMGVIALPGGDDGDLALFDPNSGREQKFQTGTRDPGMGDIIEIFPVDMDDEYFNGKSPLLAARPPPGDSNPNIASGSPDFLHVGLAALDQGLLKIRLPATLLGKKTGSGSSTGLDGVTSGTGVPGTDGLLNAVLPGDLLGGAGNLGGLLGDDGVPAQSDIWQFDPQTRRLIAHYTRPDGSTVPTSFVTGGPCTHLICLTADVDAFKNAHGESATDLHALVTVL